MDTVEGMEYILIGTTSVDENGMPEEPGAINGDFKDTEVI